MSARPIRSWFGILSLLSLVVVPTIAEVSIAPADSGTPSTVVMAITDHPDPINVAAWMIVREMGTQFVLNPDGGDRGDGRPDFAFKENGFPFVVWALNAGSAYDIAWAEWLGDGWSFTEFLTNTAVDEQDPRAVITPDGTVHVVWWQKTTTLDTVFLHTRLPDGTWKSDPVAVSDPMESARRPSILFFQDRILVAYERNTDEADGEGQEVVVAWEDNANGDFVKQTIAATPRTERLDVILHTNGDIAWLDWKHDVDRFGHASSTTSTGWGNWSTVPWENPTWVGVEETRAHIQSQVVP